MENNSETLLYIDSAYISSKENNYLCGCRRMQIIKLVAEKCGCPYRKCAPIFSFRKTLLALDSEFSEKNATGSGTVNFLSNTLLVLGQ